MSLVTAATLEECLAARGAGESSSLARLLPIDKAEEIAELGEPAPAEDERQADLPAWRGTATQEELERTKRLQKEIGDAGEELVNAFLQAALEAGELSVVDWVSRENAVSPFDFATSSLAEHELRIDAKSTSGPFGRPFHVSVNELRTMAESTPYHVYRVYELDREEGIAKLKIARDPGPLAEEILEALKHLPRGIAVSGLTINPAQLAWSDGDLPLSLPE
jgi:hypothetical protein